MPNADIPDGFCKTVTDALPAEADSSGLQGQFVPAPVPEPATVFPTGIGPVVALGGLGRQRRK